MPWTAFHAKCWSSKDTGEMGLLQEVSTYRNTSVLICLFAIPEPLFTFLCPGSRLKDLNLVNCMTNFLLCGI